MLYYRACRVLRRFTLPSWLPPTFRGTAVRYLYYVQAVVKYRFVPPEEGNAAAASGGSSSSSVASRVPLHVWPAKQQQLEAATLERTPSLLSPTSGGGAGAGGGSSQPAAAAAADGSLLSPPIQSEDVPIKCWEIGPGTAVQDAVAHIVKLASQPLSSPGRPQSPGHLPRGNSGGRGSGMLAGSGAGGSNEGAGGGGDNHSEISHEPEEVEMGPARSGGSAAAAATAGAGAAAPHPPPINVPQQPQVQQGEQAAPGSSSIGSAESTPKSSSRGVARRSSIARASLDPAGSLVPPRSPTQLLHESGSTLRSYALR